MSDTATLREEMQFKLEQIQRVSGVAPDDLIEASRKLLFNFKYPIFDEKYRAELEYKIIHKMWLQQIGATGYGEFSFRLEMWMIQKMPYYNRLYQSMLDNDYNPIDDIDFTDNRETNSKKSEEQKGSNKYDSITHNHGTDDTNSSGNVDGTSHTNSKTDTTNDTSSKSHNTNDTSNSSKEDGNSDVKNSGTKNERKTNLDPPQSQLDMSSKYANSVGITNDNHDEDTNTKSSVTSSNSSSSTEDGTTTGNEIGTSTTNVDTTNSEKSKGNSNSVTDSTSTTDGSGSNQRNLNGSQNENYTFNRKGRNGVNTRGKLIADQRKNIIDVDKLLLDDICRDLLYPLF